MKYTLSLLSGLMMSLLLVGCGVSHPSEPVAFEESQQLPRLFPDYTDVTIPVNIAPMNFMVDEEEVEHCVARMDYPGGSVCYGDGRKILVDPKDWKVMTQAASGASITITLYTQKDNQWFRHPSFQMHVAPEEIDPWLSYRLIEPSYVSYENLDIMQRDLTSFEETPIVSNHIGKKPEHCINCHSYQNYHTENMVYHVRGEGGGTMLTYKGQSRLMKNMKRKGMISNPVYPAWHPTLPLIAFSTNKTGQYFHTQDVSKVEVMDTESELVLYDVERDSMIILSSTSEVFDNFPTWSPDGRKLYYTSAYYARQDTSMNLQREMANQYKEIRYNLYVRDFNPETKSFSEGRLLLNLDSLHQSASLPRVSPDGKSLIFASGSFGCFHIWHPDADIKLLNLETLEMDPLSAMNSPRAESYPSWSSNGRWILCASRREDSNYSRVCIAYFDAEGNVKKAFVVPQEDPEHDKLLLRSYNRPETMLESAPRLY